MWETGKKLYLESLWYSPLFGIYNLVSGVIIGLLENLIKHELLCAFKYSFN